MNSHNPFRGISGIQSRCLTIRASPPNFLAEEVGFEPTRRAIQPEHLISSQASYQLLNSSPAETPRFELGLGALNPEDRVATCCDTSYATSPKNTPPKTQKPPKFGGCFGASYQLVFWYLQAHTNAAAPVAGAI